MSNHFPWQDLPFFLGKIKSFPGTNCSFSINLSLRIGETGSCNIAEWLGKCIVFIAECCKFSFSI